MSDEEKSYYPQSQVQSQVEVSLVWDTIDQTQELQTIYKNIFQDIFSLFEFNDYEQLYSKYSRYIQSLPLNELSNNDLMKSRVPFINIDPERHPYTIVYLKQIVDTHGKIPKKKLYEVLLRLNNLTDEEFFNKDYIQKLFKLTSPLKQLREKRKSGYIPLEEEWLEIEPYKSIVNYLKNIGYMMYQKEDKTPLGSGTYGVVYLLCDGMKNCDYAIKLQINQNPIDIQAELNFQKIFSDKGLAPKIYLHRKFENVDVIIMDRIDGDLYSLFKQTSKKGVFEIAKICCSLLKNMVNQGLSHGDSHLKNIAYYKKEVNGKIVLVPLFIDFGYAAYMKDTAYPNAYDNYYLHAYYLIERLETWGNVPDDKLEILWNFLLNKCYQMNFSKERNIIKSKALTMMKTNLGHIQQRRQRSP